MPTSIYLAGPDVFLPDAAALGAHKQALCRQFGFEGLFPLDLEVAAGGAAAIFRANCALMQRADVGLFNLTPFRGPSADVGTAFEVGFMSAQEKLLYGYTSTPAPYRDRVHAACGPLAERDGRPWDADGYAVEDFGLRENLMIIRAIEDAGGSVIAGDERDGTLPGLGAFEACLEALRARLASADRS